MKKNRQGILCVILLIIFLLINMISLQDGHDWGGDFSQYIQQAFNIVEKNTQDFSWDLDPWKNYPPGFPVLLSPLIKFFGLNYKILKFPNIIYWLIFLLALYPIMKKRMKEETAILCISVMATSPFLFFFKQHVLSDLPFIAFLYGSIYYFEKYFDHQDINSNKAFSYLFISLILMICCVFIRVIGFIVLASALFYIIITKKDKKALNSTLLATLLSIIFFLLSKSSLESYVYEFSYISAHERLVSLHEIICYNLMQFILFFLPIKTRATILFFQLLTPIANFFIYAILLLTISSFAYKTIKKSLSFIECFLF